MPNLPPGDPRHGMNGYRNLKCRCEICRAATTAYQRDYRRRLAEKGLPSGDSRHGTENGYNNYGCRCAECTDAHTRAARERSRERDTWAEWRRSRS
jgi:hypothetical protein